MAVCSKAHNKLFYVVAESFKFVRLYPLNQQDVPDKFKVGCCRWGGVGHVMVWRWSWYMMGNVLQNE